MNVFIETIQRYSGGYLTYLKGLLSSNVIPPHIKVFVNCSSSLAEDLGRLDDNVKIIAGDSQRSSIIFRQKFQKDRLNCLIKDYKIDVFYNPSSTMNFVRPSGVPTVTMCLNVHPFSPAEVKRYRYGKLWWKLEVLKRVMKKSFEKADGVIFHSRYAQQLISRFASIKKDAVIPVGIRNEFYQAPRKVSFNGTGPINLLYVSSVFLYKHQWHVVAGIEKLRKKTGRDIRIRLLGNGEPVATAKLQDSLQSAGNPDYIKFLDDLPVPYKKLPDEYKSCDIFVFASSCENLPNNLLEGMASGVPIACSNTEPMPDILQDGGEYFSPEDPDSIADGLSNLIGDSSGAFEKAKRAYELSREYTWERCSQDTFLFLQGVLDGKGGSS